MGAVKAQNGNQPAVSLAPPVEVLLMSRPLRDRLLDYLAGCPLREVEDMVVALRTLDAVTFGGKDA